MNQLITRPGTESSLTIHSSTPSQTAVSTPQPNSLSRIGSAANQAAATAVFTEYLSRKSDHTIRTQAAALACFSEFLGEVGVAAPPANQLQTAAGAWHGLTWGIVEAFVKWLLQNRYSVATVNNRLSAVKKYAQLAAKAGVLPADEIALIRAVNGYGRTEGKRIDARRPVTRRGDKKAEHTPLTHEQADKLKTDHADTPQGRRDALLMCLLIDHGLRVGEVAQLRVTDFDLKSGEIRFYRSKVDRQQKHKLSQDTLQAAAAYFQHDAPAAGRLLLGSLKNGRLTSTPMSDRSMTRRVCVLGNRLGIEKLSAHDCRHYWATYWAGRVDTFRLQEAGGWSSLSMPRRYTEWAKVANEGMIQ